ncbi:FHA domain-containing protein [Serpentinicella alkaliphila]|uniref:FHA domain-containing protein n=1 Tax=Serpentinicella alkaliphila TaxID=1734049 RepID=UPI001FA99E61|nr:FHA domain-containing protein [Serpentinicella alkaliphila]
MLTSIEKLDFPVESLYAVGNNTIIGRGTESNIKIEDKFISTKHAQIIMDEEEFFLEDLGSVNGTYLNGNKIEDAERLKNGDKIGIGLLEFVFVKETG